MTTSFDFTGNEVILDAGGSPVMFSESLEERFTRISGYERYDGKTFQRVALRADDIEAVREAATQAERARILAALEKIRPGEQPYTRRDWALEQRGELRMFDRVLAAVTGAIGGQERKGGV